MNSRIAFIISPHGFGHAARAASVMDALNSMDSSIQFDIFTTIPAWFFEGNLGDSFLCHYLQTDPELSQITPFQEDYANTLKRLDKLFPYDYQYVEKLKAIGDTHFVIPATAGRPKGLKM